MLGCVYGIGVIALGAGVGDGAPGGTEVVHAAPQRLASDRRCIARGISRVTRVFSGPSFAA